MISRWQWILKQTFKKLWFRATLFAIVAIITALLSILFKSMIPESVSVKVGAEAVDNILNILASSMLAVTTFSLSIMVTAYGSATTNVTPRATRLVVEDVTTQNVLATFIGSFLFSLVGIIALNMGAYGERGRVILFIVTLVVIALILITLLRWIQHLTSLGRVGETTAKVEQAAIETFIARARNPCLGGYPWLESYEQPKGTVAVYPKKIGYVEYIDMEKLSKLLANDPRHVYLVAQPGSFIHPSMPALYLSQGQESSICADLLETIIVSDVRSFAQDPRFCLSVMAEIACRALSPAVNDPGTAIDVIGRGVRILSAYAQNKSHEIEVTYPSVHVAPLQNNDLLEDFFSPVARDGASMREIQIRVLKGLSMLSTGWPEMFADAAHTLAIETLEHANRADHIDSDREFIKSIYFDFTLFLFLKRRGEINMDFYMKLPRNKKEFALFMGIISIVSVNIIAPLITCFEAGFHLYVWQDVLTVLPFIWLCVIAIVLLTYIPAEKLTSRIISKNDSFNSHIIVNILCTVFLMSILLTVVGTWIGTRSITLEPIEKFFFKWPRNFAISLFVEMCIAQPVARFVILKIHLWNDQKI